MCTLTLDVLGVSSSPETEHLCDPAVLSPPCPAVSSPPGLWEASRGAAEPGWIHELPARLQHGTLPRGSARARLPAARHLPAPAPLPAAPARRAHVLQHQLPWPRPRAPGPLHLPQGAIRVTPPTSRCVTPPLLDLLELLCWSSADRMRLHSHLFVSEA